MSFFDTSELAAHQIWEWLGSGSKKGKAKKTHYKTIQRGGETISVNNLIQDHISK